MSDPAAPPPYNQAMESKDPKGGPYNPGYAPTGQQPGPYPDAGGNPPYPTGNPQYPQPGPPGPSPYLPQGNYPGAPGPYPMGQQPQMGQQPTSVSQTTVVTQPQPVMMTTVIAQQFRESPVQTSCPHCQAHILTATQYEVGGFAWLICAILCIVGCDLGCCFIPFCVPSCKDVIHSCPNCHQQISRWSRL